MLRRSIGEAEFEEVIPHHLYLFIDHLLIHAVVFIVIDGRIDEKLTTSWVMEAMEDIDMVCGWSVWEATQKKMTLEFKCGETHRASSTARLPYFLTTKI